MKILLSEFLNKLSSETDLDGGEISYKFIISNREVIKWKLDWKKNSDEETTYCFILNNNASRIVPDQILEFDENGMTPITYKETYRSGAIETKSTLQCILLLTRPFKASDLRK